MRGVSTSLDTNGFIDWNAATLILYVIAVSSV